MFLQLLIKLQNEVHQVINPKPNPKWFYSCIYFLLRIQRIPECLQNSKPKSRMLKAQKYRLAYANLIHATNTPCVFLWIIIYLLPMVIYQFYMACEWQKSKGHDLFSNHWQPLNLDGKTKLDNLFVLLGIINLDVL